MESRKGKESPAASVNSFSLARSRATWTRTVESVLGSKSDDRPSASTAMAYSLNWFALVLPQIKEEGAHHWGRAKCVAFDDSGDEFVSPRAGASLCLASAYRAEKRQLHVGNAHP